MQTKAIHEIVKKKAQETVARLLNKNVRPVQSPKTFSSDETYPGGIQHDIKEAVDNGLSWESVKADYVKVYSSEFTVDELEKLLDFFNSPTGRKFGGKQALIMSEIQNANQQKLVRITAKILEITAAHKAIQSTP